MICVYRYGTPSWISVPEKVMHQIRLAHDLREDLVSLEYAREEAVKGVWSSYPQIQRIEAELAEAIAKALELEERLTAEKVAQRTRAPKSPLTAQVREARAAVRIARQRRRDEIATVRDVARVRLTEVLENHGSAVKALYADYVQSRGLYWASHNRVVEEHRGAVKRIARDRVAGRRGALRHHRFDGSGAIAVQLQRQQGDPERSPQLLASGTGKWRNVLQVTPWIAPDLFDRLTRAEQRREGRGTVVFQIGGRTVELPVILHRMMPPDADIARAQLVVRRVAGGHRVHITVTARIPDPRPVPLGTGRAVAVHFGWRRIGDDGNVRVATWRCDGPLSVPRELFDVVHADSDSAGTVQLPARWRSSAGRHAEIASQRGDQFELIRRKIIDWLERNPPNTPGSSHPAVSGGWEPPTASEIARWRSPGRIVTWARQIADSTADTATTPSLQELLQHVEVWRRHDRLKWESQTHGRDKAIGRRDDAWRRVAAWFAEVAGQIVLDDTNLTEAVRFEDLSVPARVAVIPTKQRIDAAPGRLREVIRAAAERRGVAVTTVPHVGLGRVHVRCGWENPADDRYRQSNLVVCDGCGATYDQDGNATAVMLAAASRHNQSSVTVESGSS